ncbi:MAG: hypothetical protein ACLFR1_06225 [Spirochaetia bacterium]
MTDYAIAMAFGILGTGILHFAMILQKYGIVTLKHLLKKSKSESQPLPRRRLIAYIFGFILNNTLFIWIILANLFAPPTYYTSMFGTGLIILAVFARLFLNEEISKKGYIGLILITAGTIVIGISELFREQVAMSQINTLMVVVIVGASLTAILAVILITYKMKNLKAFAVSCGIYSGIAASMDSFLKGIGQNLGTSPSILPETWIGWVFFIVSFGLAASSFILGQWAFAKGANTSFVVPFQNALYISFPIFIQTMSIVDYQVGYPVIAGLIIIYSGIFFLNDQKGIQQLEATPSIKDPEGMEIHTPHLHLPPGLRIRKNRRKSNQ